MSLAGLLAILLLGFNDELRVTQNCLGFIQNAIKLINEFCFVLTVLLLRLLDDLLAIVDGGLCRFEETIVLFLHRGEVIVVGGRLLVLVLAGLVDFKVHRFKAGNFHLGQDDLLL